MHPKSTLSLSTAESDLKSTNALEFRVVFSQNFKGKKKSSQLC